jgi:hypothetical protein
MAVFLPILDKMCPKLCRFSKWCAGVSVSRFTVGGPGQGNRAAMGPGSAPDAKALGRTAGGRASHFASTPRSNAPISFDKPMKIAFAAKTVPRDGSGVGD